MKWANRYRRVVIWNDFWVRFWHLWFWFSLRPAEVCERTKFCYEFDFQPHSNRIWKSGNRSCTARDEFRESWEYGFRSEFGDWSGNTAGNRQEETDFMMIFRLGTSAYSNACAEFFHRGIAWNAFWGPRYHRHEWLRQHGKVGPFPKSLPRNDEQISTEAGDLILYQGNSFVIYYDTNSWNFTRLGKIDNVTQQELKEILGSGSVTAVLSLPSE